MMVMLSPVLVSVDQVQQVSPSLGTKERRVKWKLFLLFTFCAVLPDLQDHSGSSRSPVTRLLLLSLSGCVINSAFLHTAIFWCMPRLSPLSKQHYRHHRDILLWPLAPSANSRGNELSMAGTCLVLLLSAL